MGLDVISEERPFARRAHQPSMNLFGNRPVLIDRALVELDFERPGGGVVPNGPDRARRDRDSVHGFPFGKSGWVELPILCPLGKPSLEPPVTTKHTHPLVPTFAAALAAVALAYLLSWVLS